MNLSSFSSDQYFSLFKEILSKGSSSYKAPLPQFILSQKVKQIQFLATNIYETLSQFIDSNIDQTLIARNIHPERRQFLLAEDNFWNQQRQKIMADSSKQLFKMSQNLSKAPESFRRLLGNERIQQINERQGEQAVHMQEQKQSQPNHQYGKKIQKLKIISLVFMAYIICHNLGEQNQKQKVAFTVEEISEYISKIFQQKSTENIKKRIYDITNTLYAAGYISFFTSQKKDGTMLKKNRRYSLADKYHKNIETIAAEILQVFNHLRLEQLFDAIDDFDDFEKIQNLKAEGDENRDLAVAKLSQSQKNKLSEAEAYLWASLSQQKQPELSAFEQINQLFRTKQSNSYRSKSIKKNKKISRSKKFHVLRSNKTKTMKQIYSSSQSQSFRQQLYEQSEDQESYKESSPNIQKKKSKATKKIVVQKECELQKMVRDFHKKSNFNEIYYEESSDW